MRFTFTFAQLIGAITKYTGKKLCTVQICLLLAQGCDDVRTLSSYWLIKKILWVGIKASSIKIYQISFQTKPIRVRRRSHFTGTAAQDANDLH